MEDNVKLRTKNEELRTFRDGNLGLRINHRRIKTGMR